MHDPTEIALLKIKHIRLMPKYGQGEIPHDAKTGSGPLLLSFSFFAHEQSIHKVYSNTYRIQIKY